MAYTAPKGNTVGAWPNSLVRGVIVVGELIIILRALRRKVNMLSEAGRRNQAGKGRALQLGWLTSYITTLTAVAQLVLLPLHKPTFPYTMCHRNEIQRNSVIKRRHSCKNGVETSRLKSQTPRLAGRKGNVQPLPCIFVLFTHSNIA